MKSAKKSTKKIKKTKKKKDPNIRVSTEIEMIPISKLELWDDNPRVNDPAVPKLAKLIQEYGFVTPITVDQNNVVRKGNTGVKTAKFLGMKYVPAVRVPYKEGKAITYGISDNKASEWASWDEELLYNLMTQNEVIEFVNGQRENLANVTGFGEDEIRALHFEPDLGKLESIEASDEGLRAVIKIKCEPIDKDGVLEVVDIIKKRLKKRDINAEVIA